jgi:hypothetical protein
MFDRNTFGICENYRLILEKNYSINELKSNFIGALRTVFDLDHTDVASDADRVKNFYVPLSQDMGLRSFNISYDYRTPPKVNNNISVYVALFYKLKTYIIDIHILEWSEPPVQQDLNDFAQGKFPPIQKKGVFNTDNYLTVQGGISEVDEDGFDEEIGSLSHFDSGNYSMYHWEDGNILTLVYKIKEIIDNRDSDRNDEEEPAPVPLTPSIKDEHLVGV